ncbi:unnamed protein product, partial [Scytosiphon promiscuus]
FVRTSTREAFYHLKNAVKWRDFFISSIIETERETVIGSEPGKVRLGRLFNRRYGERTYPFQDSIISESWNTSCSHSMANTKGKPQRRAIEQVRVPSSSAHRAFPCRRLTQSQRKKV